jgi:Amidohydrolase
MRDALKQQSMRAQERYTKGSVHPNASTLGMLSSCFLLPKRDPPREAHVSQETIALSERRRPAFKLPAGACDAHCHVFGPGATFPYAPNRRYTPEDAPKETLAALHAHLGIERAVIVQASCHGADNRAMLDAIAWRPDRYRGVAIVDQSHGEAELLHLHRGGV